VGLVVVVVLAIDDAEKQIDVGHERRPDGHADTPGIPELLAIPRGKDVHREAYETVCDGGRQVGF
jgi:hypothetical protein